MKLENALSGNLQKLLDRLKTDDDKSKVRTYGILFQMSNFMQLEAAWVKEGKEEEGGKIEVCHVGINVDSWLVHSILHLIAFKRRVQRTIDLIMTVQ